MVDVLLAEESGSAYPRYREALNAAGLSFARTLDPCQEARALLLPGGCDVDPSYYHEEMNGSEQVDLPLDEAQFALFDRFFQEGKPILGICRGCQLINVALGGGLVQHLPVTDRHRPPAGVGGDCYHEVNARFGSFTQRLYGNRFLVNSHHHQACSMIGRGLTVTARAEDGTVEAFEHAEMPVFAVQWHPERLFPSHDRENTADGSKLFLYFRDLIRNDQPT